MPSHSLDLLPEKSEAVSQEVEAFFQTLPLSVQPQRTLPMKDRSDVQVEFERTLPMKDRSDAQAEFEKCRLFSRNAPATVDLKTEIKIFLSLCDIGDSGFKKKLNANASAAVNWRLFFRDICSQPHVVVNYLKYLFEDINCGIRDERGVVNLIMNHDPNLPNRSIFKTVFLSKNVDALTEMFKLLEKIASYKRRDVSLAHGLI